MVSPVSLSHNELKVSNHWESWLQHSCQISLRSNTSINLYPMPVIGWCQNIYYKVWDEITYPFLNFNGATVEIKEWINNFIPHFSRHVITYPCLVNRNQGSQQFQTRRSENDNTPQPLDQWTNSPFMGQQVGNCKSFTLTHYLADLFAMHCDPRASPSWIRRCIQLASLLFQVDQPSHS